MKTAARRIMYTQTNQSRVQLKTAGGWASTAAAWKGGSRQTDTQHAPRALSPTCTVQCAAVSCVNTRTHGQAAVAYSCCIISLLVPGTASQDLLQQATQHVVEELSAAAAAAGAIAAAAGDIAAATAAAAAEAAVAAAAVRCDTPAC